MNGDGWRWEAVWGGRTPPSGNFSLPPFTGEGARRAEGGNKVAKQRKHCPLSGIVCHERYTILCIRFHAKRVTRIFVTLL